MKNLAHAFDQPIESREHQDLATTAWMGGPLVSVRYWLGRLLYKNLYRESDEIVADSLCRHFSAIGSPEGASLLSSPEAWAIADVLLRLQVESRDGIKPTARPKRVVVLRALLSDPDLTDVELARLAQTTAKQVARMTDAAWLRRIRKQLRGQKA